MATQDALERLEQLATEAEAGEVLAAWDHAGNFDDEMSELLRATPALLAVARASEAFIDIVPYGTHPRYMDLISALARLKEKVDG